MGRKKDCATREFYVQLGNAWKCKMCDTIVGGDHLTNLKRHLKQAHKQVPQVDAQPVTKKMKFSVEYSTSEVKEACTDIVTKCLMPLSFFDTKPFRTLTDPIFGGLQIGKINSTNIMDLVNERYVEYKEVIKKNVKGKLVSVKLDIATRHGRSILGVNIQIIKNAKIMIYTLATKELNERHTSSNIKTELELILRDFELDKRQIYCITTDNGRNVIKIADLIENDLIEEHEILDTELDNAVENLRNQSNQKIYSIKCAAHTLQLAVKDFLQIAVNTIAKVRNIAKSLRTPTFRYSLRQTNQNIPILDCPTRWNSTFLMLERMQSLKTFCSESGNTSLNLSDVEWIEVDEIVATLRPVYEATLRLQTEQFCYSDLYILWIMMRSKISSLSSGYKTEMLKALDKQETRIFAEDPINAAIFLDPRLRKTLSLEKREAAKKHLKQVCKIMYTNHIFETQVIQTQLNPEGPSTSQNYQDERNNTSQLRSILKEMEVDFSEDEEQDVCDKNIEKAIAEIDSFKEKNVDVSTNILEYWETQKYRYPNVFKLAQVILSVPSTQTSVERSFSSLRLLVSDLRTNLSADNIHKILFIKLNANNIQQCQC